METLVKIEKITPEQIASICDHTFLNRPEAYVGLAKKGESPVRLRAKSFFQFLVDTTMSKLVPYAVCVRPEDTESAKCCFGFEKIAVAVVVGFPDGFHNPTYLKVKETEAVGFLGADEVDMVLDYTGLKSGHHQKVLDDMRAVTEAAHQYGMLAKVIFETSELTNDEIKKACELAYEAGANFIKTSSGFSSHGARAEALKIMRENFHGGVKMSGGVNPSNVKELLYAVSGRSDGHIELDPLKVRIGESSLLSKLN